MMQLSINQTAMNTNGAAMNAMNVIKAYQSVSVDSRVEAASPYELIEMLFRGLLDRLILAKVSIDAGDTATKGKAISESLSIIEGLRASVDMDAGGEIGENLIAIYDFLELHLLNANIRNDADMVDVAQLMVMELSSGWSAIGQEGDGGE